MHANNLSVVLRSAEPSYELAERRSGHGHVTSSNKHWRLASYPDALPSEENWDAIGRADARCARNQILVRAIYLGVAPYSAGGSAAEELRRRRKTRRAHARRRNRRSRASNASSTKPGDLVVSDFGFGWQEYAALSASSVRRIDSKVAPLPTGWKLRS